MAFSTHHPTMDWKLHSPDNYFTKSQSTEVWVKGGMPFEVTTWRRPLAEISREISEAGLVISRIAEPMPQPSLHAIEPTTDAHTFGADRSSCSSFVLLTMRPSEQTAIQRLDLRAGVPLLNRSHTLTGPLDS